MKLKGLLKMATKNTDLPRPCYKGNLLYKLIDFMKDNSPIYILLFILLYSFKPW